MEARLITAVKELASRLIYFRRKMAQDLAEDIYISVGLITETCLCQNGLSVQGLGWLFVECRNQNFSGELPSGFKDSLSLER
jgi:hypothetical protein